MAVTPETYYLTRTQFAPNNDKPVLLYRDCLPLPLSEERAKGFLESHAWKHGGTWGHISQRHFHPNTHECYGIIQGDSTLLLGCGNNDRAEDGLEVDVHAGDVIVLPAGTGHCNLQSAKEFRYIGVYPEGAPKWRNELGKDDSNLEALREEATAVAVPVQDPVSGTDGPLLRLWSQAQPGSDAAA